MVSRCLLVSLVAAAAIGAACSPPPVAEAARPAAEPRWHQLGAWTGRGDRQTDSFDVTTGALQVRWNARETTPGAGRLRVSLHSAISGRPLQTVLDVRGSGADEVYFEDEPRVSYLVVEASDVDWRIELFQAAPGGTAPPAP
jgi:hypothetical protein